MKNSEKEREQIETYSIQNLIEEKKSEVHISQKEHATSLIHYKKHQKKNPINRTRIWPKVNEQPKKKGHRI